jgi:Protein of unknown function (DUF3540)
MSNLPALERLAPSTRAEAFVAMVTAALPDGWTVADAGASHRARRAASCLLRPEVGDSVACMRVAIGEWWITAVLDRAEGTPQTWHCDGPARLEVGGGLAIAGTDVRIDSPRFAVRSRSVEFTADETLFVGERMSLMSRQVRFVGAMLHSVFDRVSHFSRSYLRRTEGLDRVHAEHLEQEADTLLRISSEHTLIDGEKLVKARGGQIHFG